MRELEMVELDYTELMIVGGGSIPAATFENSVSSFEKNVFHLLDSDLNRLASLGPMSFNFAAVIGGNALR